MKKLCLSTCLVSFLFASFSNHCVDADIIGPNDIFSINTSVVGSGNGTLDLRMFTFSGSEIGNEASNVFNGDNANNSLTQGGGADTNFFVESYFTTAGELQDFYRLNFSDGNGGSTVTELAFFLDLNETGPAAQITNSLDRMDVVINPTSVQGNPDPTGDLTGVAQAAINQTYTGPAPTAYLLAPTNLPVLQQGAGFADYGFYTGINPFSLNPNDEVLINISMSSLNNGAEELFLSGTYAPQDFSVVPEPSSAVFLIAVLCAGQLRRKRSAGF